MSGDIIAKKYSAQRLRAVKNLTGSDGTARTCDQLVNSQWLYQLSYIRITSELALCFVKLIQTCPKLNFNFNQIQC